MILAEKWFHSLQTGTTRQEEAPGAAILNMWYPWTDKNEWYERAFLQAVEEYNESQQAVQVVPEGIEMELYREKLPSDIASNDTPDLYFCFTEAYLKNIADSGRVLRLNDYLSADLADRLAPEALESMTYDGSVYGLGFVETTGVFLVNTELLGKYGCEIPETWEELLAVCSVFLDHGITPLACSGDNDVGFRMYLEALCMNEAGSEGCAEAVREMWGSEAAGEDEVSSEAELDAEEAYSDTVWDSGDETGDTAGGTADDIAWNSGDETGDIARDSGDTAARAGIEHGIRKFRQLLEMGAFGEHPLQNNTLEVEELFELSKIPMYYTKNSFIGSILQKNSPLYGKIRVVPFPGERSAELLGGVSDCFVINAAVEEPQAAVTALEAILQSFSTKLYESGAGIPLWNTGEAVPAEGQPYEDVLRLSEEADAKMMFWEFTVSGSARAEFMEETRELAAG